MGPHRSHVKQTQLREAMIILIKREFSFLSIEKSLFVKSWIPFTQGCFVPCLVEIGSVDVEKKNFFCKLVFSLYHYCLPLGKGLGLSHLNKVESPLPKDALCQVWLNFADAVALEKFFFKFVNDNSLFRYYLPLEKIGPLIWTNLNHIHPGFFVLSLVVIVSVVLEKKSFKFRLLFPLWKGMAFVPSWITFTYQGSFVPSLVELDPVALEKRNFSLRQCISTISLLSSLGVAFHSNKLESPSPKNWLYQLSLVKTGPVRFERRNWNVES